MNSTERDLPEDKLRDDLIKRLRHMAKLLGVGHVDIPSLLTEAADALASIRAELDEARADKARVDELLTAAVDDYDAAWKALKPFADFVPDFFDDGYEDDDIVSITSHHGGLDLTLTVADFRRARAIAGEQKL